MGVAALLDLGGYVTREELVWELQERRAEHLRALAAGSLPIAPALMESLIASRRAEIALCEEMLRGLGEPVERETNQGFVRDGGET